MVRLAVLADIHGNLPALEAALADMRGYAVDQVVVAGDSVNWGPFSREVLELITRRNWAVVRGNNAFYALDYGTPRAPAHWSAFTLPPLLREELGESGLRILSCQPDSLSLRFPDAPPLRVVHGVPGNPWQAIYPQTPENEVARWLEAVDEDAIICAHSHIAMERHVGRWQIFNPGSVGVPLDGDHSASYMIIEGGAEGWRLLRHRRVEYDQAAVFAAFARKNFAERGGVTAVLTILEHRTARLQVYPYIKWKAAQYPDSPECQELLEEFLRLPDKSPFIHPAYRGLTGALYRD